MGTCRSGNSGADRATYPSSGDGTMPIIVTYRLMGKDYDAIVLSAGHCDLV